MDYDSGLVDFLTHQPSLESLTLLGAVPDHLSSMRLELPPTALPKLAHFHGHYTQALALVPHRPVRSVHITQVDDTGEFEPSDVFVCLKDTVEAMAHSTGPLEAITFDDEDGDYGLLEVVLSSLPDLRAVTLFVPEQGSSWVSVPSSERLLGFLSYEYFDHLATIHQSPMAHFHPAEKLRSPN
jgi:hypothetical protein